MKKPRPMNTTKDQTANISAEKPNAAKRALAEAQARRQSRANEGLPTELGGPKGEEPTRYGDWERKGLASDF